jgi:hypothetical protein
MGVLWYTSALWYYNDYQLPHATFNNHTCGGTVSL